MSTECREAAHKLSLPIDNGHTASDGEPTIDRDVGFWLSADIDFQMAVEQEKPGSYFSNQDLVLAVYVLYLASFITGFTGIIGVVIAHVKIGSADELSATHLRFQIRTFWIGLLYLCLGFVLALILVGFLILLWWCVWTLVRVIKGMILLNDGRPIANPRSWLFG